ncbi:alkene reductase [Kocuria varians]|uniref:alkene reductase n=1 Tax=Kocuria varians TaxID=1272 RepID=UPI0035C3E41C
MPSLFDPMTVGAVHVKNRVAMAPLTRMRSDEDGVPKDMNVEYYAQRASAGLVVTEGTFPAVTGRGFWGQAGIETAEQALGWSRVAEAVHDKGGVMFLQVMNAGRVSHPELTGGPLPEAPSAVGIDQSIHVPSGKQAVPTPRALETDELPRIREEFVAAARRAVDAGIDGVEVHGANGYILHEFLAPSANHRTDSYGGSPENRARFVVEVVRAVAEEIGADRVGLRISPEHNVQGALEDDHEDVRATYAALLAGLRGLGFAYLSVLHRDIDGPFVRELREQFDGVFYLNSGFSEYTELAEAEHIMAADLADGVMVGRELLANPDLVERWRDGLALNTPDPETFYLGGPKGYVDYPFADSRVRV